MNNDELTKTVDQLKTATQAIQSHTTSLARLVNGLPCCPHELLGILDELAVSDEDCSQHFVRYDSERGVPHTESSQECRKDWSRCHDRRLQAQDRLTQFAHALRMGQAEAT